jgi:hypothetical protein
MSSEKKSKKSKKKEKNTEPEKEVPTGQENRPNVPQVPEDFDIRMKFSFLKAIQQLLLRANAKVHWDPEDLIPAGMLIRDIDSIIKNLEKEQIMIQVQNQLKEENGDDTSEDLN